MPDIIQPRHSSFAVKTTPLSEDNTADFRDSSATQLLEPDSPSTRSTVKSGIGESNSSKISHRQVSINTTTTHSLLTSTAAQDVATLPEGPGFLLRFPEEHLFLLFADPDIIISSRSPQEYEDKEPGCTAAWCRCMSQVLEWIQHDPVDAPLISRQRYMQINALLTEGVQNMLDGHIPGTARKICVRYATNGHTQKGIIQALLYKQQLEESYEFCRGTLDATISTSPKKRIITDRNLISKYTKLKGKTISFRAIGPNGPGSEKNGIDKILFKYQLLALLEKEIITPLNTQLKSLQHRKINKPELLVKLIRILAKYWTRLEQLHTPLDGTCRTNYMLMQYIFMKFGFPPPVLRDPNSIDLVHMALCKKIIGIGLKNSLRLMGKEDQLSETEVIIDQYTKRYLRNPACFFHCAQDYEKYLIPEELNFKDGYLDQMKHLTKAFTEVLGPHRVVTQTDTKPLKTPLRGRKKS